MINAARRTGRRRGGRTFVLVRADEDLGRREGALLEQLVRVLGQEDAVDGGRRREAEDAPVRVPLGERQVLGGHGAHARHHGRRVGADERGVAAGVGHEGGPDAARRLGRHVAPRRVHRAALQDRPARQVPAHRRHEVHAHRAGAGRLAEQRDRARVAAERLHVVFDPLDGERLVVQAHVAGRLVRAEVEEAERADAVVDRRHDDVVGGGEQHGVVHLERRRAAHVAAAVDPHEHRGAAGASTRRRRPHVQVQAVLGDGRVRVPHLLAAEPGEHVVALLLARVGQPARLQHALPRIDRDGLLESQLAQRRLRERDLSDKRRISAPRPSLNRLASPPPAVGPRPPVPAIFSDSPGPATVLGTRGKGASLGRWSESSPRRWAGFPRGFPSSVFFFPVCRVTILPFARRAGSIILNKRARFGCLSPRQQSDIEPAGVAHSGVLFHLSNDFKSQGKTAEDGACKTAICNVPASYATGRVRRLMIRGTRARET